MFKVCCQWKDEVFGNAINALDYDIVMLTDTWHYTSFKIRELHLSPFGIYRAERKLSSKGVSQHGGALIDISTSIKQEWIDLSGLPKSVNESTVVVKCFSVQFEFLSVIFPVHRRIVFIEFPSTTSITF